MNYPLTNLLRPAFATLAAAVMLAAGGCTAASETPRFPYKLNGPLIPARMTMVTAWDVPANPLLPEALGEGGGNGAGSGANAGSKGTPPPSALSKDIQWGYRLFVNTPAEAPPFVSGRMTCNNCHLNAGQRERAMPLVGVAGAFPEYNRRAGRLITLADRIVDCFMRSENAAGRDDPAAAMPTPTSREVLALSAYLTWLSRGYDIGGRLPWRGQNTIAADALIPLDRLSPEKGDEIFRDRCATCHGPDGQGVSIGDKRPGPLWGPDSWNDGAGASRVYTLAGIIRYTMPYLNPGSLTDEEAQQLAAFITSKPRPSYPLKDRDYLIDPLPADAVYYPKRTAAER